MPLARLLLHPADPCAVPQDPSALRATLRALGMLGAPFSYQGREHYLPGKDFLDLVTFVGCSPVVALAPPRSGQDPCAAAEEFCHLCLVHPSPAPLCLVGPNATTPRCRRCRHLQDLWQARRFAWCAHPLQPQGVCAGCGQALVPADLDWRQSAGCASYFLEIWGIYPAEAVPSDRLIGTLEGSTSSPWRYFYHLQ